ncbi:MAG: ribonuclease D, partial [Planctomycetales bacterium]|nr:ribonuclease D [Planctomycetales bacterium]
MKYSIAENNEDLRRLVAQMADAQVIAFDTEFVSEFTYRPDLCLLQVAADGHLWVVDPHAIASIDEFWNALCQGNHVTIVHAGREEFRFCRRAVGRVPANWFDVQLAAGLIGLEYPTSYGKLLTRLLNRKLPKGETRTDWRRRPLSQAQLEYALQDVVHLEPLYQQLSARLQKLGRRSWLDDENARWQQDVIDSDERERWRRVSGTSGLGPRALLAVKYLWQWREEQAEQR